MGEDGAGVRRREDDVTRYDCLRGWCRDLWLSDMTVLPVRLMPVSDIVEFVGSAVNSR